MPHGNSLSILATAVIFAASCDPADSWNSHDATSVQQITWARASVQKHPRLDLDYRTRLHSAGSGAVLVAPTANASEFAILAPDRIRTIEARGGGPGELLHIVSAAASESRFYVADATGKVEVFAAGDASHVTSMSVRSLIDDLGVRGDTLIVVSPTTGLRPGATIRWISDKAEDLAPPEMVKFDTPARVVLTVGESRVLTVTPGFHVQEWSTRDHGRTLLRRNLDDIPNEDRYTSYVKDAIIGDDHLWVLISRRDTTNSHPPRVPRGELRPQMLSPEDVALVHQYLVEVVDLRTNLIVARSWLADGIAGGFLSPGCLYVFQQDSSGVVSLELWNASITNQNGSEKCDELPSLY